jgi:hypothetical protein
MDIEFHYYQTYLIAARAGFSPHDAWLIAHSAQGVDDNHIPVRMTDANGRVYNNQISQTMDIVRPHEDLLIYPIFHFIPGDPNAPSAARVDGRIDPWVTTPNSALAKQMIDAALASGDLYRIGVSAHGYVDTWAHQNFLGKRDTFNQFAGNALMMLLKEVMAVGHAHAGHQPDWPGLTWSDTRLVASRVVNRERFMDAASHLFRKLALHVNPGIDETLLASNAASLVADLTADIGPDDQTNAEVATRIARYIARSQQPEYGAAAIPDYFDGEWFSEVIREDHDTVETAAKADAGASIFSDFEAFAGDFFADQRRQSVTWKNPDPSIYQASHWYQFNQAVKSHLAECKDMLVARHLMQA